MLTPYWQSDVVIYESILLFPIYIILLIDIGIARKKQCLFQSPYYTLVISQGIADVLVLVIIFNLLLARYFAIGNVLTYNLQDYGMASFHSNTGPLLFVLRLFGVFLITLQRYLAVCRSGGTLNTMLNNTPWYILVLVHWTIPMLIYIPAFVVSDARFDSPDKLFLVNTELHMKTFSTIVVVSFIVIGTCIIVMYFGVLAVLFSTRKLVAASSTVMFRKRSVRHQEVRLAIHILLLVIMSVFTFLYYFLEYQFASNQVDEPRRVLRVYYPIVASNFSYVNPITLLALNSDVQRRVKSMFGCVKKGVADFATLIAIIGLLLPRYFGIGNNLLFMLEPYSSTFFSDSGPFFFVLRIFGVLLITLQRYLTVCYSTSRFTSKFNHLKPWVIFTFHWLFAFVIFTPAFYTGDSRFESAESLYIVNSELHSKVYAIVVIIVFAVLWPIIVLLNCRMLKVLCVTNKTSLSNSSMRKRAARHQEHRLSVHVILLTIMSIATFLYYFSEFLFSGANTSSAMKYIRLFYPIISGNFSFINPMVLLVLNKEVQSSLRRMFCSKMVSTAENSHRQNTWTTGT